MGNDYSLFNKRGGGHAHHARHAILGRRGPGDPARAGTISAAILSFITSPLLIVPTLSSVISNNKLLYAIYQPFPSAACREFDFILLFIVVSRL